MLQLRDYQVEAVDFLAPRKRGFVVAPAGSGKTLIGAAAIARATWPGQRVQILCNTREQVEQMCSAVQRVPGPAGLDIDVCCVAAQPDLSRCDVVLYDESHHFPALSWSALAGTLKPSCILWGMSATPWCDDEERNLKLRDTFREFFAIERSRVEASGHLSKGKVFVHDVDQPGQLDPQIDDAVAAELVLRCRRFPRVPRFEHERRIRWQMTQEAVQQNEARNRCAVYLAQSETAKGESVLALVYSIEHGERIAQQIGGDAVLVHAKLSKKKRAQYIDEFRSGARKCILATALADEGLDCPRASRLVLLAGGRSEGKLEQRAGRVLRPFEGKNGGVIHDFLDAGACFAAAQARARFRVYERLGYNPEIVRYS